MILGIDSALKCAGLAVIDEQLNIICTECIITEEEKLLQENLEYIFNRISIMLTKFSIQAVAIEDNFVGINRNVTKKLSNVVGVILLACQKHNIPAYLYPPATHKKITTTNGHASKAMTRKCIDEIFNGIDMELSDDEVDALSIAYCFLKKQAA
ncbi:crossover junction endodeoxyribonuclease RuvC [Heyndrickxia ginsengihumi]|uniref:crossover junction endodeoxyribonuclease RuvC n=1 Tax=Heyndrickxia ginsengihumi TaxID=363870 RepID=UPI00203AF369|nr:crossover junction endodeoxyribonuclease RuvC [Heyndrickxia ginsengihumi]MCM3025117.1 crossover junction endodeoxyribonuclease RuvC [Heyndrickxia ginsengihumi]